MLVVVIEASIDLRTREVLPEFLLGKEPRRLDVVIVRRRTTRANEAPPTRIPSVLEALPAHAVILFKGATDALEAFDATQALSYAAEYMLVAGVGDPTQVALRVVAPTLTGAFAAQVARLEGALQATARPGVHEGRLGPFTLRMVETCVACDAPHEEVLRVLSPRFLTERDAARPMDDRDRALYNRLYRCVAQLAASPEGAMAKDTELVLKNWEKDLADIIPMMNTAVVLGKLTPEQRLAGLAPEEALRALPPEALRGLSDDYVGTLPPELQAYVRARRGA